MEGKMEADNSITLGGMALVKLYQHVKNGDLTASMYILDHPGIAQISVQKLINGYQRGKQKLNKRQTKKGKTK